MLFFEMIDNSHPDYLETAERNCNKVIKAVPNGLDGVPDEHVLYISRNWDDLLGAAFKSRETFLRIELRDQWSSVIDKLRPVHECFAIDGRDERMKLAALPYYFASEPENLEITFC